MRRRLQPLGITWLRSIFGVRNAAQASMNGVSLALGWMRKSLDSMATPAMEYSATYRMILLDARNSLSAMVCLQARNSSDWLFALTLCVISSTRYPARALCSANVSLNLPCWTRKMGNLVLGKTILTSNARGVACSGVVGSIPSGCTSCRKRSSALGVVRFHRTIWHISTVEAASSASLLGATCQTNRQLRKRLWHPCVLRVSLRDEDEWWLWWVKSLWWVVRVSTQGYIRFPRCCSAHSQSNRLPDPISLEDSSFGSLWEQRQI